MRINQRIIPILAVLSLLVIASIACNFPMNASPDILDQVTTPQLPVEILPGNEPFTLVVTESQVNNALQSYIQSQANLPIKDPQIFLRDGQVRIQGEIQQSGFNIPAVILLSVYIDEQQQLRYDVTSANLGPLPVPQYLLDQISTELERSLRRELGVNSDRVIYQSVLIENGTMTLTGYLQ